MVGFVFSVIIIAFDQLTKYLIYGLPAKSIIGNIVWFESTLNTGVAFGMFAGMQIVFIITSCVCSCIISYLIISKRYIKLKSYKIALGLVLGGTLSNVFDRIIFKGVRDFIYLKFINFAIFNVADVAITIGTVLLIIFILFGGRTKDEVKS